MIFYLLLFILLGLIGFHYYIRLKRSGILANRIPGPVPHPFIGNMLDFDISSQTKLWEVMRKISKKYYPITRVWTTIEAVFSIRHPDDLEILMTSQKAIDKGYAYKFLHPWLKTGLLTSTGDKWRQRRKILTPAFHFNILSKYMENTQEQGENLIRYLRSGGNGKVHSLLPLCSKFTLNIICESAMGVALDKLDPKTVENYEKAIYKVGDIAVYRMPRTYIHDWMLWLTPFLKINRDQKWGLKTLHDFTKFVVDERRDYHKQTAYKYLEGLSEGVEETEDVVYMSRKKRLAMLDLLLSLEKDGLIDEEGIREEVDTFTFEGHDTTATAMTFSLMLLAENKDAQDKARFEVTEIVDKYSEKFGMSQIQEFHYLERCIKEAMRLYPPVSTIFRRVEGELQLKHGLMPDGANFICHLYDVHRDPNFWSEPDKFNPDRFLPENMQNRHPFSYVPFSAGPRNCIGQKFAMAELKSLIGRILYNFYLEPVELLADVKLIADLILRPSEPVHLKFIPIERK